LDRDGCEKHKRGENTVVGKKEGTKYKKKGINEENKVEKERIINCRISLRTKFTLHSSFTIDINSTKKGKRNPSTAMADTPHRQQLE